MSFCNKTTKVKYIGSKCYVHFRVGLDWDATQLSLMIFIPYNKLLYDIVDRLQKGIHLVGELIDSYGLDVVQAYMVHIQVEIKNCTATYIRLFSPENLHDFV